jgi:hypothetical protein
VHLYIYAKPEGRVLNNCNGLPSEYSAQHIPSPFLIDCPTESSGEAALDIATAGIPQINGVPCMLLLHGFTMLLQAFCCVSTHVVALILAVVCVPAVAGGHAVILAVACCWRPCYCLLHICCLRSCCCWGIWSS